MRSSRRASHTAGPEIVWVALSLCEDVYADSLDWGWCSCIVIMFEWEVTVRNFVTGYKHCVEIGDPVSFDPLVQVFHDGVFLTPHENLIRCVHILQRYILNKF
jgi:hypothetical protein